MVQTKEERLIDVLRSYGWNTTIPLVFDVVYGPVFLHSRPDGSKQACEVRSRMLAPHRSKTEQVIEEIENDISWMTEHQLKPHAYTFNVYVFGDYNLLRYNKIVDGNFSMSPIWTYYSSLGQ